jgi:hypothetical protein
VRGGGKPFAPGKLLGVYLPVARDPHAGPSGKRQLTPAQPEGHFRLRVRCSQSAANINVPPVSPYPQHPINFTPVQRRCSLGRFSLH